MEANTESGSTDLAFFYVMNEYYHTLRNGSGGNSVKSQLIQALVWVGPQNPVAPCVSYKAPVFSIVRPER